MIWTCASTGDPVGTAQAGRAMTFAPTGSLVGQQPLPAAASARST